MFIFYVHILIKCQSAERNYSKVVSLFCTKRRVTNLRFCSLRVYVFIFMYMFLIKCQSAKRNYSKATVKLLFSCVILIACKQKLLKQDLYSSTVPWQPVSTEALVFLYSNFRPAKKGPTRLFFHPRAVIPIENLVSCPLHFEVGWVQGLAINLIDFR